MIADFINYIPDTTIEEVDKSSSDEMDVEYTAKEIWRSNHVGGCIYYLL